MLAAAAVGGGGAGRGRAGARRLQLQLAAPPRPSPLPLPALQVIRLNGVRSVCQCVCGSGAADNAGAHDERVEQSCAVRAPAHDDGSGGGWQRDCAGEMGGGGGGRGALTRDRQGAVGGKPLVGRREGPGKLLCQLRQWLNGWRRVLLLVFVCSSSFFTCHMSQTSLPPRPFFGAAAELKKCCKTFSRGRASVCDM